MIGLWPAPMYYYIFISSQTKKKVGRAPQPAADALVRLLAQGEATWVAAMLPCGAGCLTWCRMAFGPSQAVLPASGFTNPTRHPVDMDGPSWNDGDSTLSWPEVLPLESVKQVKPKCSPRI
jgi:hypothetical protein